MPARAAETERLQQRFEISAGWTFGNRKIAALPAEPREQCFRRAPPSSMKERSDTISGSGSLHIKKVGLDPLIRGDGESRNLVLPGGQGLDRSLPAHVRMLLSRRPLAARSSTVTGMTYRRWRRLGSQGSPALHARRRHQSPALPGHIRSRRTGRRQPRKLGDFGDDPRRPENRELRAERVSRWWA